MKILLIAAAAALKWPNSTCPIFKCGYDDIPKGACASLYENFYSQILEF
jgi:hypothetical protein